MEINLYTVERVIEQKNEVEKLPIRTVSKKISVNEKLPVIKCCSCGAEIVVIPNVKLMSEAIETHVDMHRSKARNSAKAEAETNHIRDDLISQVFDTASEQ